ncbi:terminal flower 1-like protein-like protein [Trichodelitschia bisporula]|uniref:Terminal flower 1-like protein-like protein n=1 Tax=Trichodelitschia bisporula TaxID=703511 RepID=A0A6G1HP12_9PEZI|nr:terminal flower 1-like protein-like protein [Trichodelitschia bisporula]
MVSLPASTPTALPNPPVIDDFTPSLLLSVTWPHHKSVSLGNTLSPDTCSSAPTVSLHAPSSSTAKDTTYILTLTDPDAPSREDPKWSEFCHWIATGVPLDSSSSNKIEGGATEALTQTAAKGLEEIIEYQPPSPPEKTGPHRYVFLAWKAANGSTDGELTKPEGRQNWGTGKVRHGVRQWAEENGLVPVAANFIYSQNDKQ